MSALTDPHSMTWTPEGNAMNRFADGDMTSAIKALNDHVNTVIKLREAIENGDLDWLDQATGSLLLSETIMLAAAINTHLSH